MADDRIYKPEEIVDEPLPSQTETAIYTDLQNVGGVYAPREIADNPLPRKVIAHETIGAAINTKSKKILQEFELVSFGGLRIGNYEPGVRGDVRITPTGILARNAAGDPTFALDGDTGDAVFAGTVKAGDFEVIDQFGLVSPSSFRHNDYTLVNSIIKNPSFSTEAVSASDVLSLVCQRDTIVLISFFANVIMYATDPVRGYFIRVGIGIDGANFASDYAEFNLQDTTAAIGTCLSFTKQYEFSPGIHELQLQWGGFSDGPSEIRHRGMDYTMLGT